MADVPPDQDSGAGGTEFQTIEALRALGHQVDAVWANALPRRIGHGNLHYLLELPRAYRHALLHRVASREYDVVCVNQPHGYLAAKAHAKLGLPSVFVHRSHGIELRAERDLQHWQRQYHSDSRTRSRKLLSGLVSLALARHSWRVVEFADGHLVSATEDAIFLREVMGVPAHRIGVVPQAPPDLFLEGAAPLMAPDRLRRILHVGQYAFVKGPLVLSCALRGILERRPDVAITWVAPRAAHVAIREVLGPGVAAAVRLLDWMPQRQLKEVYDGHGVFLLSSLCEGFGKVFLEAMARGLCVVATDVGGARDIIKDGLTGRLVPPGDSDRLRDASLAVVDDLPAAEAMAIRAAEAARGYTWSRTAREATAFFERLLEVKRAAIWKRSGVTDPVARRGGDGHPDARARGTSRSIR